MYKHTREQSKQAANLYNTHTDKTLAQLATSIGISYKEFYARLKVCKKYGIQVKPRLNRSKVEPEHMVSNVASYQKPYNVSKLEYKIGMLQMLIDDVTKDIREIL